MTSYLILSLSVADLLVGVVVVVLTLSHIIGLEWTQSQDSVSCVIAPFIELACVTASVYSLLLLCVDRYRAIVLARRPSKTSTIFLAFVAIWIWSFFYATKIILQDFFNNKPDEDEMSPSVSAPHQNKSYKPTVRTTVVEDEDEPFCSILAEEDNADLPFRIADLFILFVLPVSVMVVIFMRIRRRLWSSTLGVTTNVRKKRAVIRFLAFDITVFILCWLPFYLIDIITDTIKMIRGEEEAEKLERNKSYIVLRFLFVLLTFCSTLVNPLIYAFFNKNFIQEFWIVMAKFRIRKCSKSKVEPTGSDERTTYC